MNMYTHTRTPPDSPDVPHAVILALSDGRPGYHRGELLAIPSLGAAVSRIVVADVVNRVRSGDLVLVYGRRLWDSDANAYRYPDTPRPVPAGDAYMYNIEDAA